MRKMAGGVFNKNRDPNDHGLIGNLINKGNRDPNDHGLIGNMFNKNRDPNNHGLIGNFIGGLFGGRKQTPTNTTRKDDFTPPTDSNGGGASW